MSWDRLSTVEIKNFDDSGTLSHMLILHLSLFEEEMNASNKRLPIWEPRKKPILKETDAERQIAVSQEQRRRKAKEGDDHTSVENVEHKADRPKSRVRSVSEREKPQRRGKSSKISVSRSIKRSRSNGDRRRREPRASVQSDRRRHTEPRSRSGTAR